MIQLATVLGLVATGCEEGPRPVSIADDLPLCGADETTDRGLDCASPIAILQRGLEADADTLFTVGVSGTLSATELDGEDLGPAFLQAVVGGDAGVTRQLSVCDLNGNGVTDVAYLSSGVFVVWDLTTPGDPSGPSGLVSWPSLTGASCADADGDGIDEIYGFDEDSGLLVADGASGLTTERPFVVDAWSDAFAPILAVARDPECEPVLLGRAMRGVDGVLVANEATLFTLTPSGLQPQDVLEIDDGVLWDLFLAPDPNGLRGLLWVLGEDNDRLLLYEAATRCGLDLEPMREVELPGHAMRVDFDRERSRVKVIHEPTGDAELFSWAAEGVFDRERSIEGPALDIAVIGPTDDEHVVIARPSPPFLEIEPF